MRISKQWQNLSKALPDIEEQIEKGKINVVPLPKNKKMPYIKDWNNRQYSLTESFTYKTNKGKTIIQKGLKYHRGNYAILIGYNNNSLGYSIGCIDIDGYTFDTDDENEKAIIKAQTQDLIYEALKDLPNTLQVRSQSGGYHIYYWTRNTQADTSVTSNSLYFPEDFPIPELAGKSLENSIEIFTNQDKKQVVLPSSTIYNEAANQIREYQVISTINKFDDIGKVDDLNQTVINHLTSKNYTYKPEPVTEPKTKHKKQHHKKTNLKELNDKQINKVAKLISPLLKKIKDKKHVATLAIGGYFSNTISYESASKIADNIINEIGYIFDNSSEFKHTMLKNYNERSSIENKTGLPKFSKLVLQKDPNFNLSDFMDQINSICNKSFIKKTVGLFEDKIPIILYETDSDKWLKYEGILEGIDLTLNFKSKIGSFIYSKTGEEVDSFKFKFKNSFIEITKVKDLIEFLEDEGITVPKNFEKKLRRSLKKLDKSIFKPKVMVEDPVPKDTDFFRFGETEEGFYTQDKDGIEYNLEIRTDNGFYYKTNPIANVIIKDITIVLDALGILEPVYNVTYTNKTFKEEVTVEHLTKTQLTEEFIKANVFYSSRKDNVEKVLNAFIIDGTKDERIIAKKEAYLEGFYIINGKVVENTKLQNLKNYTSEDIAESINLLNNIMEKRTDEGKANDSTVYRFMLWNPFSYCFKQLGFSKAIYSLILIGESQTNKTGATNVGRLFYLDKEEETSGSTVSVLGSKIGENSFAKAFDECSHLFKFPEALNVMKRAVYESTARATKDRNDNTKIDVFNAIALPMFILNEPTQFKDFITNRYKVINYSLKSFIPDDEITRFSEEYLPESEDTILNKLALIGREFSNKLIAIIENPNERTRLFNIEELTITILKEIAKETSNATGKEVDFLPEMYYINSASNKYNYNVLEEIPKLLNTQFKQKNRLIGNDKYNGSHFVNSVTNNDFDFIIYNRYRTESTKHKEFIINTSKLTAYINNNLEEYVELETILEALDLTDILKKKPDYKPPYSDYIKKGHKITIKEKEKNISGIYLTTEELANKLFNFDLEFSLK